MKPCPHCGNSPISLLRWCQGINAITCDCQHCKTPLKATLTTWCLLLGVVAVSMGVLVVGMSVYHWNFQQNKIHLLLTIIVATLLGSLIGYMAGGYETLDTSQSTAADPEEASDTE